VTTVGLCAVTTTDKQASLIGCGCVWAGFDRAPDAGSAAKMPVEKKKPRV